MKLFGILFCVVFAVAACHAEPPKTGAVTDVEVPEAAKLKNSVPNLQVLDVRTAEEFAAGHLEGAINMDALRPDFATKLKGLDLEQPLLVHCAVGGRSRKAVQVMDKLGFKKIYHLNGGFNAWVNAKQEVATPKR